MPFICSICEEASTQICARCTKDVCANHVCEKCLRCSDCCECELGLDEPVPTVSVVRSMAAGPPDVEPPMAEDPEPETALGAPEADAADSAPEPEWDLHRPD